MWLLWQVDVTTSREVVGYMLAVPTGEDDRPPFGGHGRFRVRRVGVVGSGDCAMTPEAMVAELVASRLRASRDGV